MVCMGTPSQDPTLNTAGTKYQTMAVLNNRAALS